MYRLPLLSLVLFALACNNSVPTDKPLDETEATEDGGTTNGGGADGAEDDAGDAGADADGTGGDDAGDGGADDEGEDSGEPDGVDNDDDGYPAAIDCDDDNPAVHPDADEVCDGIDNNCDEQIDAADPALTDGFDAWTDTDLDTFGDPEAPVVVCELTDGFVDNSDDCDDTNEAIRPDADEICDEVDNDCDAAVDDADDDLTDGIDAWVDGDGDTFGSPADPTVVCALGEGVADNNLDCDDTLDTILGPTSFFIDSDGDGYGAGPVVPSCTSPEGHVDNNADCDDEDVDTFPGSTLDASESECMLDADGDGYGDAAPSPGFDAGTDCDDDDPNIHPEADDYCGDDVDSDCDEADDWGGDCIDLEPQDVVDMYDGCARFPAAGFTVSGDHITVAYGDDGFWHNADGDGLSILPPSVAGGSSWAAVNTNGANIDEMDLRVEDGSEVEYFSGGYGGYTSDFELECARQIEIGDVVGALHHFSATWSRRMSGTGGLPTAPKTLNIYRTELWNKAGNTMLIHFTASLAGGFGTHNFRIRRQIEPDMGSDTVYNWNLPYFIGTADEVSDWTVGWGSCNRSGRIGGFEETRPLDVDDMICDPHDITDPNMTLAYQWEGTVSASFGGSSSVSNAYLMSVGQNHTSAFNAYQINDADYCGPLFETPPGGYIWGDDCEPPLLHTTSGGTGGDSGSGGGSSGGGVGFDPTSWDPWDPTGIDPTGFATFGATSVGDDEDPIDTPSGFEDISGGTGEVPSF